MKKIVALAFGFALAATSSAFAQTQLVSQTPAAKEVLTAKPAQLTLKFSDAVALASTGVEVTNQDEVGVTLGDASLDPSDNTTLVVPVSGKLAAGVYTVAWHALSTSGDKVNGTYTFTIK